MEWVAEFWAIHKNCVRKWKSEKRPTCLSLFARILISEVGDGHPFAWRRDTRMKDSFKWFQFLARTTEPQRRWGFLCGWLLSRVYDLRVSSRNTWCRTVLVVHILLLLLSIGSSVRIWAVIRFAFVFAERCLFVVICFGLLARAWRCWMCSG